MRCGKRQAKLKEERKINKQRKRGDFGAGGPFKYENYKDSC